jgi:transposase
VPYLGIDLAKTVFQFHAVDAGGVTVIRKRLRRGRGAFVPCGSRTLPDRDRSLCDVASLTKFEQTVKLMPPAYVKPYVKRGKNDATDAEAICEAVGSAKR